MRFPKIGRARNRTHALAAVLLAIVGTAIATTPANASAVRPTNTPDCGHSYQSAFDTSDARVDYDLYIGAGLPNAPHTHIHRSEGEGNNAIVEWARITNAPAGSYVWLDWSDNRYTGWHQCGPYQVDGSQGAHDRWTWAVPVLDKGGRSFRACGSVPGGPVLCTPWGG